MIPQSPQSQRGAFVDYIQLWAVAACKLPSQTKVETMPANIQSVIIENIVRISGLGFSRSFEMVFCIQRWFTAECDQYKRATQLLGQLGKSTIPRNKSDRDKTKVMIYHKTLSDGRDMPFEFCQGPYIDIVQPAVRQNGLTSRVIPHNWRAMYNIPFRTVESNQVINL